MGRKVYKHCNSENCKLVKLIKENYCFLNKIVHETKTKQMKNFKSREITKTTNSLGGYSTLTIDQAPPKNNQTLNVDRGSTPGRVKQKTTKIDIQFPCLTFSINRNNVKPPPCVVDRWQNDSKTQRSLSLSPGLSNLVNKM